ncbi:protein transport protein HofB [Cricetibacter osteomyelitidis]|uniref:Protein transport protein HofB n=1 Tax=Cricetibacter osteomyelitidis TaxID=1521931 RepID=A0A4R2T0Y2_9PAST|nr:GspE/PulE family protein [Cricetibacter osteomyelitidis]TCP95740.1 protein transport protein HofB [Cricetibacter osteomyelitidis]
MYYQSNSLIITAISGEIFEIAPHLWQKNQQQQTILLRYLALPLKSNDSTLWLAVDSLSNLAACETFAFLTGKIVEPILVESHQLKQALQQLSPQISQVQEPNQLLYLAETTIDESTYNEQSDEPVICLLNSIFENALKHKASDIHLEPQTSAMQIRFRIDGVLQPQTPIALSLASRIISRLKLLAKLDISETRLPQDGRFHFKTAFSDMLDFRLSTLPTHLGEKAVLRLQQNKPISLQFSELGMTEQQQTQFRQALSQPQGLILVTGPTGSGKSISLYTALQWLNGTDKHIMTAEDPIEIELDGIIQTQINPQIGLDFSRLLRTFLRQDPDVIMLGEIRDEESAAMALRAAQTGHLVLSTLHTNDAKSAVSRLRQLGIRQHEIDSCLLLVIAQRLVRKKCQKCGKNIENIDSCTCHQGYAGRIGVYQFLMPVNRDNRIEYQTDFADLRESALHKINEDITDLAEIDRVLGMK